MSAIHSELQSAGDVDIQDLILFSSTGIVLEIKDYLVELNIYEDLFSNFLTGDILISDSRNLIKEMPIIGEEFLIVKVRTPSLSETINRVFRVYGIADRVITKDHNTQLYRLKFSSVEAITDSLIPLHNSFKGKIDVVVKRIYDEYLKGIKNFTVNKTSDTVTVEMKGEDLDLRVLVETDNSVQFVSPGWSPMQCINWLCSKSIPKTGKACNFLFWETTHGYYFGSIESLFILNDTINIGTYTYAIPNNRDTLDIVTKMYLIEDLTSNSTTDYFSNFRRGYLANKLVTLDITKKHYNQIIYDHVDKFNDYQHSQFNNPKSLFTPFALRNANTNINFYPVNTGLFSNLNKNVNERIGEIYGNRISNMLDLQNFKLNVTIPGRTDVEVGTKMTIYVPNIGPKAEEDLSNPSPDSSFSGDYLITAICHKINLLRHSMIMEVIKDSNYE
ncbi:MAG: hypothetical protein EBU90_07555 [Proteobacteria bacterium]|nr:hypothetical protein [Pseudomonadota bacterium]NBP13441.1 hypothetical protein [bacterium]